MMKKELMKKINGYTIFSLLVFIAGLLLYLWWGITYNVWIGIGIYSLAIPLILFGLVGIFLSLLAKKEE